MGDNAADTTPAQCSSLRKGGYVMLKGNPCKIIDMSTSKTGKHGHAKVNMAVWTSSLARSTRICPPPPTT